MYVCVYVCEALASKEFVLAEVFLYARNVPAQIIFFLPQEEQLQMNSRRQSDPFRQIGVPLRTTVVVNNTILRKSQSESFRTGLDERPSNEVQAAPLQDGIHPKAVTPDNVQLLLCFWLSRG